MRRWTERPMVGDTNHYRRHHQSWEPAYGCSLCSQPPTTHEGRAVVQSFPESRFSGGFLSLTNSRLLSPADERLRLLSIPADRISEKQPSSEQIRWKLLTILRTAHPVSWSMSIPYPQNNGLPHPESPILRKSLSLTQDNPEGLKDFCSASRPLHTKTYVVAHPRLTEHRSWIPRRSPPGDPSKVSVAPTRKLCIPQPI